jgi:hypothetical protein
MIGTGPVPGVFAAGDNSLGHLWNKRFKLSPRFIPCDSFPYSADDIVLLSAWNQSLAAFVAPTFLIFKQGDSPPECLSVGVAKQICCTGDTVLCLLPDGRIIDPLSGGAYAGADYKFFAASSTLLCARDAEDQAVLFAGGPAENPQILVNQVITVGCTDSEVYVSTESALLRFVGTESSEVLAEATIVAMACSDTEALFLDFNGVLWRREMNTLIQIFGIPPVVSIAAGPQHFAAISADGKLFTWGFNPSGQLGIGNDQATVYPSLVLDQVAMVACGTHHTLAVRSEKRVPPVPERFDRAKLGRAGKRQMERLPGRIARAELLF